MGGVFATHADGSTSRARPVFRFGLWVRMSVAHGEDEVVREAPLPRPRHDAYVEVLATGWAEEVGERQPLPDLSP